MLKFEKETLERNIELAMYEVVYTVPEGTWFDAAYMAGQLALFGHDEDEGSIDEKLSQWAESSRLERKGKLYRMPVQKLEETKTDCRRNADSPSDASNDGDAISSRSAHRGG